MKYPIFINIVKKLKAKALKSLNEKQKTYKNIK